MSQKQRPEATRPPPEVAAKTLMSVAATEIILRDAPATVSLDQLVDVAQRAEDYAQRAKAVRTVRAYASDWRDFTTWCSSNRLQALPAESETVAHYLTELADRGTKAATLARRLVSISQAHKLADLPSPTTSSIVRRVHAGIRRSNGTAQIGKAPALVADVKKMAQQAPDSLRGARDRALLLLGFAGAFRRSELVGLDVADVEISLVGMVATLRKSKTDQEGYGRRIGIPYGSTEKTCPVRALQAWLDSARISSGPVFRPITQTGCVGEERLSDKSVANLVKQHAQAIGLDPSRFAGHSLRAGLATSAAAGGASERAIMRQTGHKSTEMVRRYIREAELLGNDNAARSTGL